MIRSALAVTLGFTCLVYGQAGNVVCWGDNTFGQCDVPVGELFVDIAAGEWHSVGLRPNGTVLCWGRNSDGQCDVPDGLSNVVQIDAGPYHTIALKSNGEAVCWGSSGCNRLEVPEGEIFTQVSAARCHNIGVRPDGTITGWGEDWDNAACCLPEGLENIAFVRAGRNHNFAVKTDGSVLTFRNDGGGSVNVTLDELLGPDDTVVDLVVDKHREPTTIIIRLANQSAIASGYLCDVGGNAGASWPCENFNPPSVTTSIACSRTSYNREVYTFLATTFNGEIECFSYGYGEDDIKEVIEDPDRICEDKPTGLFFTDVKMGDGFAMALTFTPCPDSDGDGTCDSVDGCPLDPNKTTEGICGCGVPDLDSDQDGSFDCNDECPNDPTKITADACGCGIPETNVPGDVDCDGDADADDLAALNALVGSCSADLTNDGEVGFADLLEVISSWGPCSG